MTGVLKIGGVDSTASIKSMQVVKDIGTISNTADYNTVVIPAFNQGNQLLNLQVVEKKKDHQYTLTSNWVNTADGTQNYSAVVTATPKNSLKFTADSMPQTLKVNVDGTNIKDVSVTNSSVDENGVLTITYDFEKMFIGGSLRMDYVETYEKTSMRYGYDFILPDGATFVGCEWYYGTSADNLTNSLIPDSTKYITNPDNKGEQVYRSNIVFTNIGKANYKSNVYSRILVKYLNKSRKKD